MGARLLILEPVCKPRLRVSRLKAPLSSAPLPTPRGNRPAHTNAPSPGSLSFAESKNQARSNPACDPEAEGWVCCAATSGCLLLSKQRQKHFLGTLLQTKAGCTCCLGGGGCWVESRRCLRSRVPGEGKGGARRDRKGTSEQATCPPPEPQLVSKPQATCSLFQDRRFGCSLEYISVLILRTDQLAGSAVS